MYSAALIEQAAQLEKQAYRPREGAVGWSCPSNIALIKYWGKRAVQIPQNPSLSMTLSTALTTTRVKYRYSPGQSPNSLIFKFDGKEQSTFQDRIQGYLDGITSFLPFLRHTSLEIASENSFPHSSGIASSASSMGALALCLVSIEEEISGKVNRDTMKKASFLARLGSGSASRSIYPYFAEWGATSEIPGSSDEYATPLQISQERFKDIRDSILIVESGQKQVSSSAGHKVMETNPFANIRFKQAHVNLKKMKEILDHGDWDAFIELMEEEALSLHAMMMTGRPGYLLMKTGTLEIIQKVQNYRKTTKNHLGFTLDAGANVHLLYDAAHEKEVKEFITSELLSHCENRQVIHDRMGTGPKRLDL